MLKNVFTSFHLGLTKTLAFLSRSLSFFGFSVLALRQKRKIGLSKYPAFSSILQNHLSLQAIHTLSKNSHKFL
jgi:hypothetical protein